MLLNEYMVKVANKFLLIVFFATSIICEGGVGNELKFKQLTTSHGLSHNQISCFFQDDQGFIWIGTLSGLNQFDGYEVKTFYKLPGDTQSIAGQTIDWMSYGPQRKIWIKTRDGISIYDEHTKMFKSAKPYLNALLTSEGFINGMVHDKNGASWFSIENRGLVKLEPNGQIVQLNNGEDSDSRIASNRVSDLTLDKNGNLWVCHEFGLVEMIDVDLSEVVKKYGLPEKVVRRNQELNLFVDSDLDLWLYSSDPFGLLYMNTKNGQARILEDELPSEVVTDIIQNEEGELWIGADHGGIAVLNKNDWSIHTIQNNPDQAKSLNSNNVKRMFLDRNGVVWIGTVKGGVNYFHRAANNFNHFKYYGKEPAYNDMSSFVEDEDGYIWIGTNGKGLLKYDPVTNEFINLSKRKSINMPEVVVSLLYTSDGRILVGTYLEGLLEYRNGRFRRIPIFEGQEEAGLSIWDLYEDSRGNIWVGTLHEGAFLLKNGSQGVVNYRETDGLLSNYVPTIDEDADGNIWLGSDSGLNIFSLENEQFRSYTSSESMSFSLSNNLIQTIFKDSNNNMWVGTIDGLCRYDKQLDGFEVFKTPDGLSSNFIMSILEDDDHRLWISTSRGITEMNYSEGGYKFNTYDLSDGLQSESFTEEACLKTSDGRLIFSGQNGFNFFNPNQITVGGRSSKLLLTNFFISNQRVSPKEKYNGRVILNDNLNQLKNIELEHNENSIGFEFVALSFFQAGKIRYQYMLEGFNKDWVTASPGVRSASYNNLNYGDYTFRLRSLNNPTASDDEISLSIHINPPFWQTTWATVIYFILGAALLYWIRTIIVRREREKAREESSKREAIQQHELDMMKLKFFTNISHDLRTPLSLILTPIERMITDVSKVKTSDLTIVHRNAKRLMDLVNQLLDFRKIEANQHVLNTSSGDIVSFLNNVVDSFRDLARESGIELSFDSRAKKYYTMFDKDKLEKVMFNLLSNAFKFTLSKGKVEVAFELKKVGDGQTGLISVIDTGIGIPENKQHLVFNRFFQSETNESIVNNGTGIGLAIAKEFVHVHGGTIRVQSKPGQGSNFIVELPLKNISTEKTLMEVDVDEPDNSLPKVFIVEDNSDFRFYLKDNLKVHYRILEANNGKDALKMIRHELPDIVVSDVMMPKMDGRELCEKLKTDPRTANIPVILLTAQGSDQHRIAGLESGAIEYISKPFNFDILVSSINSALKFHQRVKEVGDRVKVEQKEVEVVSMDEQLIEKAVAMVEENISNSDLSVEHLSHELGYSRGHFYQKILKITGQTPVDFIRKIRLKRAADLLSRSQMNVSEVAYKVGYNNPKLFSRYFKSQYKIYPSEFKSQSEGNSKKEIVKD